MSVRMRDVAARCGELSGIGGAEIEEAVAEVGDGVDGGAAGDVADVEGGARRCEARGAGDRRGLALRASR